MGVGMGAVGTADSEMAKAGGQATAGTIGVGGEAMVEVGVSRVGDDDDAEPRDGNG